MLLRALAIMGGLALIAAPAHAGDEKPKAPLVQQVRTALDHGIAYLKRQQSKEGDWEASAASRLDPGGWTGLVLLALLEAGEPPSDPAIVRGLAWFRQQRCTTTYA